MDLLRAVLQPSFNQDIMAVFSKYQKVSSRTKRGGGGVIWFDLCRGSSKCVCVAVLREGSRECEGERWRRHSDRSPDQGGVQERPRTREAF